MNIEELKESLSQISLLELVIVLTGMVLLAVWLLRTSFGREALIDSKPRRNKMPVYTPVIPLLMWFVSVWLGLSIKDRWFGGLGEWQDIFAENVVFGISVLPAAAVMIIIARASFARRLKGFGLDVRTVGSDFGAALVNLVTILPVVGAMIVLTTYVNTWFIGPQFEMPQHEELKTIASQPEIPVRVVIFVTTVFVIPVFEELFFRGIVQTLIRSYLGRPWFSIMAGSAIFVAFHQDVPHWPALFCLGLCMGYSYEKSGSLLRAIFIHMLFNATCRHLAKSAISGSQAADSITVVPFAIVAAIITFAVPSTVEPNDPPRNISLPFRPLGASATM